ncbi:MAG: hypothetical protein KatS3mg090_0931 [Patescibacteria group bacterium]|nr:MAG: hypothetical protein KatS3mg090_0931 [Patescibacteria group bacterium]
MNTEQNRIEDLLDFFKRDRLKFNVGQPIGGELNFADPGAHYAEIYSMMADEIMRIIESKEERNAFYLVVCGPPRTGTSTTAAQLGHKLKDKSLVVVNLDELSSFENSARNQIDSNQVINNLKEKLKQKKREITEQNNKDSDPLVIIAVTRIPAVYDSIFTGVDGSIASYDNNDTSCFIFIKAPSIIIPDLDSAKSYICQLCGLNSEALSDKNSVILGNIIELCGYNIYLIMLLIIYLLSNNRKDQIEFLSNLVNTGEFTQHDFEEKFPNFILFFKNCFRTVFETALKLAGKDRVVQYFKQKNLGDPYLDSIIPLKYRNSKAFENFALSLFES